ncbi:MAG: hypothetical protein RIC14_14955 [Filomicrobium sp.]
MQGHMIAFQSAMTRTGEMTKSNTEVVSSIAAIKAAVGDWMGRKS